MVLVSLFGPKDNPNAFEVDSRMFRISPSTAVLIATLLAILAGLYIRFW